MGWMTNQPTDPVGKVISWTFLGIYLAVGLLWQLRYSLLIVLLGGLIWWFL